MREVLEILGQPPASTKPREGPFDNPSTRKNLEAFGLIRTPDDLHGKLRHRRCRGVVEFGPLITTVREHFAQKGKFSEQRGQNQNAAVTILDVRRMDHGMQQQAYRVDKDMPLLAFDLLAGIIAGRIDRGPPFSALFTLWLSMTQAVGLASRPACSRHST